MSHSYETGRGAMAEIGAKQPHELVLMLGGLLALLLTLATYGIQWLTTGIPQNQYATVTTAVIINVVLGGALWASSAITRKNLMNGAIVAGVISIILIYFGGRPGTIGGVVGILGAILRSEERRVGKACRDRRCRLRQTSRTRTSRALPRLSIPARLTAPRVS